MDVLWFCGQTCTHNCVCLLYCSPELKDFRESQLKVKQLERVVRTLRSKQYVAILSLPFRTSSLESCVFSHYLFQVRPVQVPGL